MMRKTIIIINVCILLLTFAFANDAKKQKIDVYGFIKLDTAIDDSLTDNPDAPKYVVKQVSKSNQQFTMTAMNSRLGINYTGLENDNLKVTGKFEIDFLDSASDNSQKPRMRLAYIKIAGNSYDVVAGQAWDIFSPLGSNTLITGAWLWCGGNIALRRPQLRLTKHIDKKCIAQVSVNRNIGVVNNTVNSGENSNIPVIEGRLAHSFNKVKVGLSGLFGKEEYVRDNGTTFKVNQEGVSLDVSISLLKVLDLKSELFYGKNLDAFLGGVQGINIVKEKAIDTNGGWLQLTYKPSSKYEWNICYGLDDPDNNDLNNNNISLNNVSFFNFLYSTSYDVKFGCEYSYFRTQYINAAEETNNRITFSVIYYL
ncbi:hypothetical protein ACFL4A_02025 [bacterium]